MKIVLLVVLIASILPPSFVAAKEQTPKEAHNAISIDVLFPILLPASLLWEGGETDVIIPVSMQYQRVISDHFVVLVNAALDYGWNRYTTPQDGWFLDVNPLVEIDWHPFHKGLKGFYAGLSGVFNYTISYSDAAETKGTSHSYNTGLGLNVGWLFLLPANIIIDLALGQGIGYLVSVDMNGVTTSGYSEAPARIGVFLGFRF